MKPTKPKKNPVLAVPSGALSTLVLPTSKVDEYLTIGQLLQVLPVSSKTLYMWRKKNIIPAVVIGGTILYSARMVHDIIQHKFDLIRPSFE